MKMSGAAILVKELSRLGVDTVFGYPGGYVLRIYDELFDNDSGIRHILTASEQGAAFAADAYARASSKTGVVIATGGPGATNLVTGIANSYLDSVPVVYITGNVAVPMLGQDSFQDIDIIGVSMPIVKHSYVIWDIASLQECIAQAFQIASFGRRGPVHIDIPINVQSEVGDYDPLLTLDCPMKPSPDISQLARAANLIKESKRPFIYCGGGVTASGTGEEVMELSKMLGAPIVMSLMGIGSVPHSFDLNLGMGGLYGSPVADNAISEADLIIAAGVRFSDRATGSASEYRQNTKIIHLDIDSAEIGKNIRPDSSLCGDLQDTLPALIGALKGNGITVKSVSYSARGDAQINAVPDGGFSPRNIISCVNGHYGSDTVVTTDVGQHQMWVAQYYRFEKPRTLISSGGLGAMGYGLGAAIGASIARGGKRTVLFTGDGSFGMNLSELATAVTLRLPITIILMNNGALGMVRQLQSSLFDKRYSSSTLQRITNFTTLASAFGAVGYRAESISELRDALLYAPDNLPTLIECKVSIDEMA